MHLTAIKAFDPDKDIDEQKESADGWISMEPTEEEIEKYGPDIGYGMWSPAGEEHGLYYFSLGLRIAPNGRTVEEVSKLVSEAISPICK